MLVFLLLQALGLEDMASTVVRLGYVLAPFLAVGP